ncbi:MAG: hypothetical protein WBA45_04750 [Microthrixaceae bacterium]
MRGTRNLAVIITLCLSIVAVGCGVAADDTAATVGGRSVSIESVNDIARDPLFSPGGLPDLTDYVLPGDMFRSALAFEITRSAWIAEAERWGLDLDSVHDEATSQLDSQLAQSPPDSEMSASLRKMFVEYYAAQILLGQRFQTLDPKSDSDLRRLYEGVPGLWERTCAWIVSVPDGSSEKVAKAIKSGKSLKDLPAEVEGTTLAADPSQSCISDSSMPPELSAAIRALPLNKVSDELSLTSGGVTQVFVAEVESRESLSFKQARTDLEGIATSLASQGAQPWVELVAAAAKIDSRFGSGVQSGQSGPSITPPSAPVVPAAQAGPSTLPPPTAGASSDGADSGGANSGGADSGGASTDGASSGGANSGGATSSGASDTGR